MDAIDRKLNVFLCHASQDKPIVRELYQRLLTEDWIDPWLDEERILPGQDWEKEIEKAVKHTDAVLVCLSKNSTTKEGFIRKELRLVFDTALEKIPENIFLIPVLLEKCSIDEYLGRKQYVEYFPSTNRDFAFQLIKGSLKSRGQQLNRLNIDARDNSGLNKSVADKRNS